MNRTRASLVLCSLWLALLWPAGSLLAYRDLETGTFLTRDPAGMVDGPNLYAYVNQNPWTKFDPEGLSEAYRNKVENLLRTTMSQGGNNPTATQFDLFGTAMDAWMADRVRDGATPTQAYYEFHNKLFGNTNPGTEAVFGFQEGQGAGADAGSIAAAGIIGAKSAQLRRANSNSSNGGAPEGSQRQQIEWVKENVGASEEAKSYEAGAAGHVPGQAPQLSAKDADGVTVTAKFDGVEGDTLIDRKTSVTTFDKSKKQALRQSAVLQANGYQGRWEVPDQTQADRATTMFKELGVKNIQVKVVKPDEKQ